jgi:hypothetical protein
MTKALVRVIIADRHSGATTALTGRMATDGRIVATGQGRSLLRHPQSLRV